jgi:hypothetical protein
VGKPEGKRQLGRPRLRGKIIIKIDFKELGLGGTDWIHLTQDRDQWSIVVRTIMNLRVP